MTQEHHEHQHGEHGHEHHGHAANPFTHPELVTMHADDRVAARNIVLLMVGIFIMGLAGYIAVDFWVAQSHPY